MCGICGIIDPAGIVPESLERMNSAIAHRGPDDAALHIENPVGLGHRRLAIIDLESGQQPIFNADRSLAMVFNGEIYNYRALRAELESEVELRTQSDTEILLHLYEREGPDCLARLRGMFAFAIWDRPRGRLFAARDHLGQKPFYYHHDGERFAFASEIKALLAWDPSLRELDEEALSEYLALRIVTPPRSMYRRVRKLPPGHRLIWERGTLTIERYWKLNFRDKIDLSFDEAVDALDRGLHDSVEHHLVSDVPVGAFLSGGLDSSMILGVMSEHMEGTIPTFTGDLPYGTKSELPFARDVSKRYGTKNHELTITPSLVEDLPQVLWHLDEPSDPLSVCLFALSKTIREHVKVVLGGDGGDELFAGYDRYYGHRYAGYLALIPGPLRRQLLAPILRRLPAGKWYRGMSHRLQWLLQMADHEGGGRYAKSLRYFYFSEDWLSQIMSPAVRQRTASFDPEVAILREFGAADATEMVDRMLHTDATTRMPDHPVMLLDRMTMAHGLEARSPFLDHELAQFCASLPPEYKLQGRKRRVIQNALAKRYVPESILTRDKQGFSSAFPYMMAQQFHRLYESVLRNSSLVDAGVWQREPLLKILDQQARGVADHGTRLWLLCNAELWYRLGVEDRGVERVREEIASAVGEGR